MSPRSLRWFAVLVGGLLALSLLPIGALRPGRVAEAQGYGLSTPQTAGSPGPLGRLRNMLPF